MKQADEADLRLVRFLWCGNNGTVRAKASSLHGLEVRMRSGIGLTVAMQAMNALDQLQPVEGMGPVGEPVEVDPATIDEGERSRRGIVRLPATQERALDALEADEVLTGALGPVLASSYLAVRRSEWAAYSAGDDAFEQQGHFSKY